MIDFKGITEDIATPSSMASAGVSGSGAVQVELRQAVDYFKMAMEYLTQGRFDDAEQLYRMALNVSETAMGMDNPAIIGHLEELSNFYMNRAKFVEAEPYLKRIYALRINSVHDDSYFGSLANTIDKLAMVFERTARPGEAEKLYLNLLRSQEKSKGGQDQTTLEALSRLGNFYQRTGVYAAARAVFEELLEIQANVTGADSPEVGVVLSSLSVVYGKLELYMEQIAVLERQVQVLDTIHGGCGLSLASALSRLADVLSGAVRLTGCNELLERAELVYRRALSIYEKHYGPSTATVENLRLRLKKLSN